MPRYQEIQPIYDPLANAAGNFGQSFGRGIAENYRQRNEGDELGRILDQARNGQSDQDVLRSIYSSRNLPLDQKHKLTNQVSAVRKRVSDIYNQREKLRSGAGRYVSGELKARAPDLELRADEVVDRYNQYLENGIPQSDALIRAISDVREQAPSQSDQSFFRNWTDTQDALRKKKDTSEYPYHYGSALKKHPIQALAGIPISTIAGLENLFNIPINFLLGDKYSQMHNEITGRNDSTNTPISDWLRGLAGIDQLPQEAQEAIGTGSSAFNAALPFATAARAGSSSASAISQPKQITQQARNVPPATPPANISPRSPVSPTSLIQPVSNASALEGRVSSQPNNATELRIDRTNPEQRIYPRLQNIQIREQQLRNYPQYVEEIEADAAKRAIQAESRIPKTIAGRDAQRLRVLEAQKNLPQLENSYMKSAARVRALEDEVVKLSGIQRESAETLLQLARRDLDDATFNYRNGISNLRGVNPRSGIEGMRTSAREKMSNIQEAISNGEEYELAKRDYSPDLIREAKRISKKKPIPHTRGDDFYNEVHDVYAQEYQNRLNQISKEIERLRKDRTLANLYQMRNLSKEHDILKKMIESANAEKTIHNYKFGLRQTAERQKAAERFKKLQRSSANPSVQQAAQENIWRGRIEQARTPQERAQVIDQAVQQIAAENPAQAAQINAEGQALKDSIENMFRARNPQQPPSGAGARMETGSGGGSPPPNEPPRGSTSGASSEGPLPNWDDFLKSKTANEAAKSAEDITNKWKNVFENLKNRFPKIFNTKVGKDVLVGMATAVWDNNRKEYDIPVSGSSVAIILAGNQKAAGVRYIANQLTRWWLNTNKINSAAEALRRKDAKKFNSYSASVKKKAKQKVYGSS